MRRIRLISMAAVLLAGVLVANTPGFADTYVGGRITGDTVWDKAGSPYILTEDLTIDQGVTLTIHPGVVVYGNDEMYKRYAIYVKGALVAKGTPKERIIFDRFPGSWQWYGIQFRESSDNEKCILRFCCVLNANTAIVCRYSSPQILNCRISAEFCGIYSYGSTDRKAIIRGNEITACRTGIAVCNTPVIEGNKIKGNRIGISCDSESNPRLRDNDFYDIILGGGKKILDASNNYWSESALSRMEKRQVEMGHKVDFDSRLNVPQHERYQRQTKDVQE